METRSSARQRSVGLCNQGIEAKRSGNYGLALQYYDRARRADPVNPQVYYNIGKLRFGIGEYDQAFRNLLTYADLGLSVGLFNQAMLPLVGQIYYCHADIAPGVSVRADIVQVLCLDNPLVFSYASDPNLARYAGLCYLGERPGVISYHGLDSDVLESTRARVLSPDRAHSGPRRPVTGTVLTIGFLYLAQNLFNQPDPGQFDRYLSYRFAVDKALERWDAQRSD